MNECDRCGCEIEEAFTFPVRSDPAHREGDPTGEYCEGCYLDLRDPLKTVADVKHRIEAIARAQGYAHLSHPLEDELHRDVLAAIADGTAENPAEMARIARSTWDRFEFSRWYD